LSRGAFENTEFPVTVLEFRRYVHHRRARRRRMKGRDFEVLRVLTARGQAS
jgi:hypothetical protein